MSHSEPGGGDFVQKELCSYPKKRWSVHLQLNGIVECCDSHKKYNCWCGPICGFACPKNGPRMAQKWVKSRGGPHQLYNFTEKKQK